MTLPISADDIVLAHSRIASLIHRTPILTSEAINKMTDANVFFKCENFQKVGAFKARGASNVISQLNDDKRIRGVITHSSGNHGQAVAKAAHNQGIDATVIMPSNSPEIKIKAVRGYGAKVILCEPTQEAREITCQKEMTSTKAILIPPYDDYGIITGQATCAKEIIEDCNDVDCIIAPVGGGGLLSGTALSAHYFGNGIKVFGAEPILANDTQRSFRSGEYSPQFNGETIADGVRVGVGELTFPIIQLLCEDILTASEDEIITSMRIIWERLKIVVEASCALPLAVLLKNKELFKSKNIALIITGGNVDLEHLPF